MNVGGNNHNSNSNNPLATSNHNNGSKKKSKRGVTVSEFLRATHKELKAKITTIQEQIRFIQDLALMDDNQKVETLFGLIDKDSGGTVDATELAKAMRQNDELSFSDSIDKAIDMVAKYDRDGDGELDVEEFGEYVFGMVGALDMTCSEFCELIIVQLLVAGESPVDDEEEGIVLSEQKIETEIKKRRTLYAFISDERVVELFELFGEGQKPVDEVSFVVVSKACKQSPVIRNVSKKDKEALEVLLMTTKGDDRTMDLKQFGRLIISLIKMSRSSFERIAESLQAGMDAFHDHSESTGFDHSTAGGSILGGDESSQVDTLTYCRLKKLFRIWDADGDGDISATELSNGLEMFQKATGIRADAKGIAEALISFDEDGDGQLDPREFSEAMVHYAKIQKVDLNLLIDFMCMVSAEDNQDSSRDGEERGIESILDASNDEFGSYEIDMWMD